MKRSKLFMFLCIGCIFISCTSAKNNEQKPTPAVEPEKTTEKITTETQKEMTKILLKTTMGDITIGLYNETPLHRDNFIKLVTEKFYDGVLFHRVIQNFMIQTGDPDSKTAAKGQALGTGGPGYTIPAEIVPTLQHKRGAVAAARLGDQVNPNRESSGSQFYIVDGMRGAPHLNGQYTVFGEVLSGMETVDKIAAQPKDGRDRPQQDIKIIEATVLEN